MQLNKHIIVIGGALALSSCGSLGSNDISSNVPVATNTQFNTVSDTPVKIGDPFTVKGKTYTPVDVNEYDEVGYASWYGENFEGRPTANGEIFSASASSGAHKTLPLPSYVEVTALDTGRTILVRLNDRGPFANDRLIDLSEGAARQLGIIEQGVAGVRVRKVNPPEQERAVLRNGRQAAIRPDTPESLTRILRKNLSKQPKPVAPIRTAARPATPIANGQAQTSQRRANDGRFIVEGQGTSGRRNAASSTSKNGSFVVEGGGARSTKQPKVSRGLVVQLSSFSSRARAEALARKAGAKVSASSDGRLFRVRYGPYSSETEAQQGLANARQRGYSQARIFRE